MKVLPAFLMLFLLLALVAPSAIGALPRAVWFSYMDNTSIVDEISGYDGVNNGCVQVDRDGNDAIHCDDNSYIRTPKNSYTNLSQNFTVCWYGLANVSDGWQVAWSHYNETSLWGGYQSTTTRPVGGNPDYYDYGAVLTENHWYYVCIGYANAVTTIDASNIKIYVNGTSTDQSAAGSASILYNNHDYILGGVNTTDTTKSAFIDNMAYFDRVLTQPEINSLWNNSGVPDLSTTFAVGTCGGNKSYPFMNITIYDEDTTTDTHTTTVEIDGNLTNGSLSSDLQITLTGEDSYLLCSSDKIGGPYDVEAYMKYYQNDVITRHYIINDSLSVGTATLYSLYMLNDTDETSILKLTLRKASNYNYYTDVITKLQRYYVGESVYKTVQMDKSDDYGLTTFNILERTTDYRLLFLSESEELLGTSKNLKFVCSSGLCELVYLIDDAEPITQLTDFSAFTTYNASSGIITINWTDPLGGSHSVNSSFVRHTITGVSVLCSDIQAGASGLSTCNVSGYNGAVLVTADTSTQNVINEWVSIDKTDLYDALDSDDAVVITTILFVTILGIGAASTIASLIAAVIGLVIILFLGLFTPITVGFVVLAAIGAIAIGLGVRKNR